MEDRRQLKRAELSTPLRRCSILMLSGLALFGSFACWAQSAAETVGFIRSVQGAACIQPQTSSARCQQPAAQPALCVLPQPEHPWCPAVPLMAVEAGDVIVVAEGTLVVVDVRAKQEQVLGAGSKFVMPRSLDKGRPRWLRRLQDAAAAVATLHLQKANAAVRGNAVRMWPNGVRFAPNARIDFRWMPMRRASALRMRGPQDHDPAGCAIEAPPNPATWPPGVGHLPGQYTWELLQADTAAPMASATFEILSEEETAAQTTTYRVNASRLFPAELVDLGTELLAAEDKLILK
jgi:hypothetical protein